MKNTFYIILTCLFLSFLGGCSDELDQAPAGKISLDDVFKDNDKTMYYLNSCYSSLPNKGLHWWFWERGPVSWCDDSWNADDIEGSVGTNAIKRFYTGNASASNHPVWATGDGEGLSMNYWPNYFARIRNCGVFLQNIATANVTSETDRSRWTAEAHLLRAYYYSELLYWFGCGLPIIKEPYTLSADFSTVVKSSYSDVARFVIEDCDFALGCDDLPWRITSSGEQMRVTKALAWAIKSRVSMFAASPLYATGDANAITWDEAYKYSNDALTALLSQGYDLYRTVTKPDIFGSATEHAYLPNDYSSLYNEYFCYSMDYTNDPADKETIFQLIDNNADVCNVDGIGSILGYKTGTCPSQELVDAYETTDGQPILNLANPYGDDEHLQPNYNKANTLYNPQNPYANRDPRFYASIYYNGALRYCNYSQAAAATSFENAGKDKGKGTRVIATWDSYQSGDKIINSCEPLTGRDLVSRTSTRTGYYERKFLHPNSGVEARYGQGAHKDYRLGEIYLNLAETAMESGHTDDALKAMNTVRSRVGMPSVSGISGDELRLRIHNERRVELAMEGNRFFDVRRWHKPDEDLSATDRYVTAAHITHMEDGSYTYGRAIVYERNCYANKWLKAAIPLSEINNVIAIKGENWQNPGW